MPLRPLALAAVLLLALVAPVFSAPGKPTPAPRVSMNVTGEDLRVVLKRLAARLGLNLYAHPEVQGKVTLQVKDVPAEGALKLVLQMQPEDYGYKIVDGTLVVASPAKLKDIPDDILSP